MKVYKTHLSIDGKCVCGDNSSTAKATRVQIKEWNKTDIHHKCKKCMDKEESAIQEVLNR